MTSKREHLILQIKEVEDSIRHKYKSLRNAEAESQVAASSQFQPLIEPIETLTSNVQHLLKQRGDSTQHKEEELPHYQKNIDPMKMEEEEEEERERLYVEERTTPKSQYFSDQYALNTPLPDDTEGLEPMYMMEEDQHNQTMRPVKSLIPRDEKRDNAVGFTIPPDKQRDNAYGPAGETMENLKMNDIKVVIGENDVTVGDTRYNRTEGLLSLLFYKKPKYEKADLETYRAILKKTGTHLKPAKKGKAPQWKSHGGKKYYLVRDLMEEREQAVTHRHKEEGSEEEGSEEEGSEEKGSEVSTEKRAVNGIPFAHLGYPQYTMESKPSRGKKRWSNRLPTPYQMSTPMFAIGPPQASTPYQTSAPLTTNDLPPREAHIISKTHPKPRLSLPEQDRAALIDLIERQIVENRMSRRKKKLGKRRESRMHSTTEDDLVRRSRRRGLLQPPRRLGLPWVDHMMLPTSRQRLAIETAPRRLVNTSSQLQEAIEVAPRRLAISAPPARRQPVYLSSAKRRRRDLEESHLTSNKGAKLGRGLPMMELKDSPISYRYWDDPNELLERLKLLKASRDAGNNGLDEEIMSIVEELAEAGYIKDPKTYQM